MKQTIIIMTILLYTTTALSIKNIKFHTMSPSGGLSYDGIMKIQQDTDGLVWVLLQNNLFRFDGYNYKSYKTSFSENAINNVFNDITTEANGAIYVRTSQGLFKYNSLNDSYDSIEDFAQGGSFYIDSHNKYWINNNNGIAYIDSCGMPVYAEQEGKRLSFNRRIYCEHGKSIIVFSNFGKAYQYNIENKKMEMLIDLNEQFNKAHIIDAKIKNNLLWILTNRCKLFGIDLKTKQVIFTHQIKAASDINIKCLYVASDHELWIGTINGLYILNTSTKKTTLFQNQQDNPFSLPHNSIWTISEDKYNNIWIGTFMGSIGFVSPYDSDLFKTYHISERGLNKVPVSGFADDNQHIWISTESGGVNILNKTTGTFSYLQQDNGVSSLSSNNTKSMVADKDGNIWISTFRGGLDCYNSKSKQTILYKQDKKNKETLLFNNLRKIIEAGDSGLWIIYQEHTGALTYFNYSDKKCNHYYINLDNTNDYIYDICEGNNGQVWLITSGTLHLFNITTKQFTNNTITSQKNSTASTLCINEDGDIWIGTFGNELIRYDILTNTFHSYTDFLQGNITEIYSINHSRGKIWLATNNGLYLFDISTKKCTVFNESDGSQGNVFYPLSTLKTKDGLLYFGGAGGFSIVDPTKIGNNPIKPRVIISDLLINNKSILSSNDKNIISVPLNNNPEVTLTHNQQNFEFKISSSNYLNPDKNIFKYRLRNYHDQWITTEATGRNIQYSKIPPGVYYFEVMTANNDGIWGETATVKIIRKQTMFLTVPFISLYIVLFGIISFHLITSYKKRKKLEFRLYMEEIEKSKNEEIHTNQLRFFTNVSHDLKTPLALIMTTVNKMREEGMKEYYYKLLNSNSVRLLNLLNDLLDFRKVQDKSMQLKVAKGNLNQFIKNSCAEFTELARKKNIDYAITAKESILECAQFDRKIIEKIILNLVNNSFKYTMNGGKIAITVSTSPFKSSYGCSFTIGELLHTPEFQAIHITVSDNGIGISEQSIKKVFDRFYRVESINENKHLGSGIGLALVKELVLLHKGDITIYSEREVGTDIVVRLALDSRIYSSEEIDNQEEDEKKNNTNPVSAKPFLNFIPDEKPKEPVLKKTALKTILIAEDNEDLINLLKSSLTEDYNVIDFKNGRTALEYLKTNDTDLIISDIMMPETDGITFCKTIKRNMETSHIPFILLTAKTGLDSRIEGGESGADLYYEKPIDLLLLKLSISNIFKQQDILREYYSKNYFADVSEITSNKEDCKFLTTAVDIIETYINEPKLDVNFIAQQMNMSRSKLYSKIKALTGKSVIEFILLNRLRKAAKLLIEQNVSIQEAMFEIGIESQSYFTTAFKKEFGMPPSKFILQYRNQNEDKQLSN